MFRGTNIANRPIYISEIVSTDSNGKIKKISIEKTDIYSRFAEVLESKYYRLSNNGTEYEDASEWYVGSGRKKTTYKGKELALVDWFNSNYDQLIECDHFEINFEITIAIVRDWIEAIVDLSKVKEFDDFYDEYGVEIELKNITEEEFMRHFL